MRRAASGLLVGGLLALSAPAWADYALLQDGRALFNVRVVDTQSTAAGPLRVVYKPDSFGYDFFRDTPFLLRGHSGSHIVEDYVTTSSVVGKAGARQLMAARQWQHHRPSLPEPVPQFRTLPPTPVPTPTPEPPPPTNVADASLPIEQRIQRQLDIFISEQTTLAEQLKLLDKIGTGDAAAGKQQRLELLKNQMLVLEKYYPGSDDLVQRTKEALTKQRQVVEEKGKFNFED